MDRRGEMRELVAVVIPGRTEGASPESITPTLQYGFRARRYAAPRNDNNTYFEITAAIGAGGTICVCAICVFRSVHCRSTSTACCAGTWITSRSIAK